MRNRDVNLGDRLLRFAAEILKITTALEKTYTSRHIAGQLVRSATSAGANWEETCGAESKADFIHKLQIVLKELRESLYWLKLIEVANLLSNSNLKLTQVLQEARELTNIIGKSIVTAKSKAN